jgi:hypothetical protein
VSVIRIPVPDALVAMVRVLLAPDIRPLAVQDADGKHTVYIICLGVVYMV